MRKIILSLVLIFSSPFAFSTQVTGKITKLDFYGKGASEVIFVTMTPGLSACTYKGRYMMYTKERPSITSALLAALHSQTAVTIYGTGKCHHLWMNDEELDYASFTK